PPPPSGATCSTGTLARLPRRQGSNPAIRSRQLAPAQAGAARHADLTGNLPCVLGLLRRIGRRPRNVIEALPVQGERAHGLERIGEAREPSGALLLRRQALELTLLIGGQRLEGLRGHRLALELHHEPATGRGQRSVVSDCERRQARLEPLV